MLSRVTAKNVGNVFFEVHIVAQRANRHNRMQSVPLLGPSSMRSPHARSAARLLDRHCQSVTFRCGRCVWQGKD